MQLNNMTKTIVFPYKNRMSQQKRWRHCDYVCTS